MVVSCFRAEDSLGFPQNARNGYQVA